MDKGHSCSQLAPVTASPEGCSRNLPLCTGWQLPLLEPANETVDPCLAGPVDAWLYLFREQPWPSLWPGATWLLLWCQDLQPFLFWEIETLFHHEVSEAWPQGPSLV